ncbi:uracil phosphoribosyltransferase [uncultured Kordia sp.]|uniref:DUF6341 family protein n=1 Tax=uncultured Kordia sp. TaxID=507699 RepID=UPI002634FE0D|nr:uracil phosphoribosyltransferase [uncultured Kordia sp.]
MKNFFEGIASFSENTLLAPFESLRETELTSWFLANGMNWLFMIVGAAAMIYWVLQLKKFNDNNEESKEVTAHSYL